MTRIVVTRHAALVELLRERGLISPSDPILPHAGEEDVSGKHVIGVLPLHLAALAASVTVVPIRWDRDGPRGDELNLAQLRERAGEAVTYTVRLRDPHENTRCIYCLAPGADGGTVPFWYETQNCANMCRDRAACMGRQSEDL